MQQDIFRFDGNAVCREGIQKAKLGDVLSVQAHPERLIFLNSDGNPVAVQGKRGKLFQSLQASGMIIHHASVNSVHEPDNDRPNGRVRIRVCFGEKDEVYRVPPAFEPRSYPVNLVGESFCQAAIRRCRAGQPVTLWHEFDNEHDRNAIVAVSQQGEKIGYLGRGSWLYKAINEEGEGASAAILSIDTQYGTSGIVLRVLIDGTPIYKRPARGGLINGLKLLFGL